MNQRLPSTCGSAEHLLHRRAFLGGVGGFVGGVAGLDALGNPLLADQLEKRHKRVILLWMAGGLSQFESWDPKPGRKTGGPFQTIQTSVPGYRMSELMPKMAARIHKTSVIRSFSSPNTGHTGGSVNALLSGDRKDTGNLRTPSLGCLLGRELSQPGSAVPDHVSFWNATWPYSGGDKQHDFALFLGARYEPINIASKLAPDGIQLPASLTDGDHRAREALREQLAARFQAKRHTNAAVAPTRPLTPTQWAMAYHFANQPDVFKPDDSLEVRQKKLAEVEKAVGTFAFIEQPFDDFQVGVDEPLKLSNDEGMLKNAGTKLLPVLRKLPDTRQQIDEVSWTVLSRPATSEEHKLFGEYLEERKDRLDDGLKQVLWALLNSPEFRFNH